MKRLSNPLAYLLILVLGAVALSGCGGGSQSIDLNKINLANEQQAAGTTTDEITFAILPRYTPEVFNEMFGPLVNYLSAETGVKWTMKFPKDFAEVEEWVKTGKVDYAYLNPEVTGGTIDDTQIIATSKEAGATTFNGIVIARTDTGINTLADLKGKKVMAVGKTSGAGFVSQKITLAKEGIDVDKDMTMSYAADNKHENVLLAVFNGTVDAGMIRETAFNLVDASIDPSKMKIVRVTEPLPNWGFVATPKQKNNAAFNARVQDALVKLKKDDPVVQAAKKDKLDGFIRATNADYELMRRK